MKSGTRGFRDVHPQVALCGIVRNIADCIIFQFCRNFSIWPLLDDIATLNCSIKSDLVILIEIVLFYYLSFKASIIIIFGSNFLRGGDFHFLTSSLQQDYQNQSFYLAFSFGVQSFHFQQGQDHFYANFRSSWVSPLELTTFQEPHFIKASLSLGVKFEKTFAINDDIRRIKFTSSNHPSFKILNKYYL